MAASKQDASPKCAYCLSETVESLQISRYRVVVEVALNEAFKPLPSLGYVLAASAFELLLERRQRFAHTRFAGVSKHFKPPLSRFATTVRKSKEFECFGFPFPTPFPVFDREAAELDQARLLRV